MTRFPGKLAIQQRVLTTYRAAFFDTLALSCDGGLSVCAGLPRPEESIATTDALRAARFAPAGNVHILHGPLYFCYQRGLLDWLADWNPDALVVEANPRYLSTPAALRWMHQHSRPVIGWGLGAPVPRSERGGLRGAFLRNFDALLTYSRRGAEQYTALGFPAEKIFVAPNAATPPPVQPLPVRPVGFNGRPNVLFVGRLQARKRIDALLHACAALPEGIQPRLVIVGDGPERAALEALAKTVYPRVEFPGAQHGPHLAPYFLAADLFVLPGTGGLAVQEAMSWGLPIVMGQGDGTNDDLVRPENGWQLASLEALADVLRAALADASRLRAMGGESYRIVAEEVNFDRMAEVFMQTLGSFKTGI